MYQLQVAVGMIKNVFREILYLNFSVVTMWRGHVGSVTCLTLAEEHKMLLSSSMDCTVRVWTFDGEYVGE